MDAELMLDVGQANELKLAFRRAGWTNADIKKLCEGETLSQLLPFLKGDAKIMAIKDIIDCDADPFIPDDWSWSVKEHIKGGQLKFDPAKVALHLDEKQHGCDKIVGTKLHKKLKAKPCLNANVLDYLLACPEHIPEEWKSKVVFFWGTIYRESRGLLVRCLFWGGEHWSWGYRELVLDWDDDLVAAVARK